jgi:hypothetical protein
MDVLHRDVRQVARRLERNGYVVGKQRRGGHYPVFDRHGHRVASLPSTPGRGRALANLIAHLRRDGLLNKQSRGRGKPLRKERRRP